MIKFKKHKGKLFRMLDKPVPLTQDAEMPCLVRLIQDDSPMGRYNRDAAYSDVIGELFVAQKIKENPFYSNTLHAYEKNSLNQDYCIASIHTLEIIGYPVADGSAEWALWNVMHGNVLSNPKHGLFRWKFRSDGTAWDCIKVYKDGWIIEPEKPLLADAQVGDLCRRMDGKWVQICATPSISKEKSMDKQRCNVVLDKVNGIISRMERLLPRYIRLDMRKTAMILDIYGSERTRRRIVKQYNELRKWKDEFVNMAKKVAEADINEFDIEYKSVTSDLLFSMKNVLHLVECYCLDTEGDP